MIPRQIKDKNKKSLTKEDILHLAKLSKLQLTDEEIEKFRIQLSAVVDYIGKLNQVNTNNTEPVSQITGMTNVSREDIAEDDRKLTQNESLKNARSKKDNYFKVKAIFTE